MSTLVSGIDRSGDTIEQFLDEVERFAQKKFFHRFAIALVLRATENRMQLRNDFFFLATFVANASQVLSRQGTGSDETKNLAREFSENMGKVHELLRTIVKDADEESKQRMVADYLTLSHETMAAVLGMFREIVWVKSYEIERKGKQ